MFYLFYGTDQRKVEDQVRSIVGVLRAKREFAQVFHVHADSFSKDGIESLHASNGLFFDKHVFVYKGLISSVKDTREYILGKIEEFIESPHIHILVEEVVDKDHLKKIQKYTEAKIKEYNARTIETPQDISKKMFNTVAAIASLKLMDPAQRTPAKKLTVWKQVDEIRNAGTAPEEFFGILWWKYKTVVQASGDKKKVRADVSKILNIYHDAHNGEAEMWEGLEAWVLA